MWGIMNSIRLFVKKIRAYLTGVFAEQTLEHLEDIRLYELDVLLGLFPPALEGAKILEIGGGWVAGKKT